MSGGLARLKVLLDGNVTWVADDGVGETEHLSWRDRWTLFGVHSFDWWWVKKYGRCDCGCTRNPLTRRMVLYRMGCPVHSPFGPMTDAERLEMTNEEWW